MCIIICGSSGILGKDLCNLLNKKEIKYIGTYNTNPTVNGIKLNFLNYGEVFEKFKNEKISTCVNLIVERQLEICENDWETTKKINIDIPNILASVCEKLNIHIIHLSTDYVFDGRNPPYYPESQVNPLQNYGISKLISEYRVKTLSKKHTIIRVPVLFTDSCTYLSDNAVTLIGKKILNRTSSFTEDNHSIRRPLYIPDLCHYIYDIINEPIIGTFHFSNYNESFTKYEISQIIRDILNKPNNITPINDEPKNCADRPKDTFLKCDATYKLTTLKTALTNIFTKFYHPKLSKTDTFLMLDLDGTLIDSESIHFNAYNSILDIKMSVHDFENGVDEFLNFHNLDIPKIKNLKLEALKKTDDVKYTKGAEKLISYILNNDINHVVVTNSNSDSVSFFRNKLPLLNKLKNWITREDYERPKPSSDGYILGRNKFLNSEKYIIGIENTMIGYKSLKGVTDCIYIIGNEMKKCDAYFIDDLSTIVPK